MMSNKYKLFLTRKTIVMQISILLISISCFCGNSTYPILSNVQVNDLHICTQEILPSFNSDDINQFCGDSFSSDYDFLYLCGELSGIHSSGANLEILLFEKSNPKALYSNYANDSFFNGYFCQQIRLPDEDIRRGNYIVKIAHKKPYLESVEFKIE